MDLTTILNDLMSRFSMAIVYLEPVALGLLTILFGFELSISIIHRSEDSDPLKIFLKKLVTWVYLSIFITQYKEITEKINESFIWLASKAAGVTVKNPEGMPSIIIRNGLRDLKQLIDPFEYTTADAWVKLIVYVVGVIIVCYLALEIFVAYLEYSLLVSLVIIFLPFNMFEKTRFMGERVFSLIISQNMKIFLLTFLVTFITKYLNEPLTSPDIEGAIIFLSGLAGLAFLASKTAGLATSIIQGTPQISSGMDVKSFAAGAMAGAVAGHQIAQQAGQGASQGGLEGYVKGGTSGGGAGAYAGGVAGAVKGGISGALKGARSVMNKRG